MCTVLVVDVHGKPRDLLVAALTVDGCEVAVADSWDRALDLVREGGVDVLLAEIHMPDGSGWDLFPRVHAVAPSLPVVAMTSDDSWETALRTRARGAPLFFYAVKPLDLEEIRRVVACAGAWQRKSVTRKAGRAPPPASTSLRGRDLT